MTAAERELRLLVVHGETLFCAGAQKMLGYFLEGAAHAGLAATVAMAPNAAVTALLPPSTQVRALPSNQAFTLGGLLRQTLALRRAVREGGFEVLHGWTARDWELTSMARWSTGRPGFGLLHDHPFAPHISRGRRRLMRFCARRGLDRILCVSGAVADACAAGGYPADRLRVVRNGLPHPPPPEPPQPGPTIRLGYLGVFSERKGLRLLFDLLDRLGETPAAPWELRLAGGAQDDAGRALLDELRGRYSERPWWSRLQWAGWVRQPADFLATVDLLIVPSTEFDPFPTVLLEAGSASRPVFAARVGGVPEIVIDDGTGWLFDPHAPAAAAQRLATLLADPARFTTVGAAAAGRVRGHFSVVEMARGYREAYREVLARARSH